MPFSCLLVTLKNVFSHENFFWKAFVFYGGKRLKEKVTTL